MYKGRLLDFSVLDLPQQLKHWAGGIVKGPGSGISTASVPPVTSHRVEAQSSGQDNTVGVGENFCKMQDL